MEINRRIPFSKKSKTGEDLYNFLKLNGIPFKEADASGFNILNIYESSPYWNQVSEFVKEGSLICSAENVFTKKELSVAEWLTVRCKWRNGYPQPEERFRYKSITYDDTNYCRECGSGLIQIDLFRLRKAPKWGSRHFMFVNWVEDEFFVTDTVKNIFEKEGISGISFCGVKNKNGTEYFQEVNQMKVTSVIPHCFPADQMSVRETTVCPSCSTKKHLPSGRGMQRFYRDVFNKAPDVVKTSDVFGWGRLCARHIIVRQKVYRTILDNDLGRGLVFEPIELI